MKNWRIRVKTHLFLPICTLIIINSFAVDTTTIVFSDFSDLSNWQLNGTCRGATNADKKKVLRLTNSTKSQSGSAFIKNPIQLISDKGFLASFSAYFSFQISNTDGLNEGDGAGADGLVFVIQTVANNVGSVGGGLGYRGIPRSIGIEFDTWNNSDSANDPDHNHVGIDTNGSTRSIKTYSEKALFNNGKIWYAWIDYDGDNQILEVRYDSTNTRPENPKLSQKINIPSLLVEENVYVGFTSATGLSYNIHDILSINFINKFQPYLYSLSLSALPDTTVNPLDSVTLIATVRDMNNTIQPDSSKKTKWRIIDAGDNSESILKTNSGAEALLIPQVGNSRIIIEAKAIVNNQTLLDTIVIHVTKEDSYSLKITASPDTIVKSHSKVTLKSNIYDDSNKLLSDSAKKTVWKIIASDMNPESILQSNTGAEVDLIPLIPYTTVLLEASVTVKNQKLTDTIRIHVTAGDPYRISIETMPVDKIEAKPLERLTLSNYPDSATVYAVVRDKWGGYCRMADSNNTTWQVISGKDIATVTGIVNVKCNGLVKRLGPTGEALIEASEGELIKDSLPVTIGNIFIEKIVIRDHESKETLDSIIVKVKQPKTLDVYGLITGTDPKLEKSWILVKGDWSITGVTISADNPLPKNSETWTLVADAAGQGILSVVSGKNEVHIPVIIQSECKITVAVSSNPFNLQETVSGKVASFYENVLKVNSNNGVIIAVNSSIPLKVNGDSYGTATIFDPVGNVVRSDLRVVMANSYTKTDYGIFWDGTNKNNRRVGAGSYLIRIKVCDIQGKDHVVSVKVGVVDKD